MKIITNPTDSNLKIKFIGVDYVVEAKGSIEVEPEVASFWKTIHAFIEVTDVTKKVKEVIADEVIKEIVDETAEKKIKKTK